MPQRLRWASGSPLVISGLAANLPCRRFRESPTGSGPPAHGNDSFSTTDAISRLKGLRRPQMWSRLREVGHEVWFEDQRIFVVPNSWSDD